MRKARIAELILSLFTTRERASATIGDLMEDIPAHGGFRFWLAVARTACSLLWSDLAAEPFFMARLALRAVLLNLFLIGLWFFGMIVFTGFLRLAAGPGAASFAGRLLAGRCGIFAVQFQTGRWVARRANSKEMVACTVYFVVQTIAMSIIEAGLMHFLFREVSGDDAVNWGYYAEQLVGLIALFAGAIWVRSRRAPVSLSPTR